MTGKEILTSVLILSVIILQVEGVKLSIEPSPMTTGDKFKLTCNTDLPAGATTVSVKVSTSDKDNLGTATLVAGYRLSCNGGTVKSDPDSKVFVDSERTCDKFYLEADKVTNDWNGYYWCEVTYVSAEGFPEGPERAKTRLLVGDKTPPIATFTITNTADGNAELDESNPVQAGTNVTVECTTKKSNPSPKIQILITDRETRENRTMEPSVKFYETLPRKPSVTFNCTAFNGFGAVKFETRTYKVNYPPLISDIDIPNEIETGTEEVLLCSVTNNPPKTIQVEVAGESIIDGEIRYEETGGVSKAFAKLTSAAANLGQLKISCKHPDLAEAKTQTVTVTDRVTTINSTTSANSSKEARK